MGIILINFLPFKLIFIIYIFEKDPLMNLNVLMESAIENQHNLSEDTLSTDSIFNSQCTIEILGGNLHEGVLNTRFENESSILQQLALDYLKNEEEESYANERRISCYNSEIELHKIISEINLLEVSFNRILNIVLMDPEQMDITN